MTSAQRVDALLKDIEAMTNNGELPDEGHVAALRVAFAEVAAALERMLA